MPYIEPNIRPHVKPKAEDVALTPGELNYQICVLLGNYLHRHGLRYQTINDIVGALACAQQEVYRRLAAPYEDRKREENGDVFF
jgi:hypothetical protein